MRGVQELVAGANAHITTYTVDEAKRKLNDDDTVFIDVRDGHEMKDTGVIPGAIHASRGMLEFYVDETSPYHREEFRSGKELVFYCKSGGRSALAAERAQEKGVERVASMDGGMQAWKEAGGPTDSV